MISMKSIEKIGVKGYAFKNYGSLELSFAEFSGRRTSKLNFAEFRIHADAPFRCYTS